MSSQNILIKPNLYEILREVELLDLNDKYAAKEIFNQYASDGVLVDSIFDDNTWTVYDEYNKVNLNFMLDELAFRKSPVFNTILFKDFKLYLKMFTVGLLGNYVGMTMQTFIRELKAVINSFDGRLINSTLKLQDASIILDFIGMIKFKCSGEYGFLVAQLEMSIDKQMNIKTSNRRQLSTFQSYFKFNDLLDDYWNSQLSDQERIFYFPIYLWWHITSILPLRPREFLLTPRDCFKEGMNKNVITFRRTKLKGSKKKMSYNIDDDYELCFYDVGDVIGNQIREYIRLTKDFERNSIDTLFRADQHYSYFGKTKRYDSRLFSYANMRYCLKRFYIEIIQGKYKLNPVNKKHIETSVSDFEDTDELKKNEIMRYYLKRFHTEIIQGKYKLNPVNKKHIKTSVSDYGLKKNEIEFINIGDTRHIAMINIIASGGTPTTAMMLAGHSNIDISSHYFANLSTLIECKTHQTYLKSIDSTKTDLIMDVNYSPPILDSDYIALEDEGKCYSTHFIKSEYDDCYKSVGENGEIGDCFNCFYYRANDYRIFVDDKEIFTKRIADDCDFLAKQINLVRQGKGYEEDIKQALLKLHSNSKSYEKYFYSKLSNGGN